MTVGEWIYFGVYTWTIFNAFVYSLWCDMRSGRPIMFETVFIFHDLVKPKSHEVTA